MLQLLCGSCCCIQNAKRCTSNWAERWHRKGMEADMELNGSKRRQQMNLQHLLLLWQLLSLFLVALSNNYVAQANE